MGRGRGSGRTGSRGRPAGVRVGVGRWSTRRARDRRIGSRRGAQGENTEWVATDGRSQGPGDSREGRTGLSEERETHARADRKTSAPTIWRRDGQTDERGDGVTGRSRRGGTFADCGSVSQFRKREPGRGGEGRASRPRGSPDPAPGPGPNSPPGAGAGAKGRGGGGGRAAPWRARTGVGAALTGTSPAASEVWPGPRHGGRAPGVARGIWAAAASGSGAAAHGSARGRGRATSPRCRRPRPRQAPPPPGPAPPAATRDCVPLPLSARDTESPGPSALCGPLRILPPASPQKGPILQRRPLRPDREAPPAR